MSFIPDINYCLRRICCFYLFSLFCFKNLWRDVPEISSNSVCVSVLLQAANSYLRDQWFHSLQWKVRLTLHSFIHSLIHLHQLVPLEQQTGIVPRSALS